MRKLTTLLVTLGILGTAAIASADERYFIPSQPGVEVRDHRGMDFRGTDSRDIRRPDEVIVESHRPPMRFHRGFVWVPPHREWRRGMAIWIPGHYERMRTYGYGYGYRDGRRY